MFQMKRPFALPLLIAAAASNPSTAFATDAFESLKCIPDLPYERIEREFSALLDKPECAEVQVRANTRTHLLFVRDCRPQRTDWTQAECKTFGFQINNATTETPQASGARFFIKGTAKWCRPTPLSRTWSAAEPEVISVKSILKDGPTPPLFACREPSQYTLSSIAPTQPATPTPVAPDPGPGPTQQVAPQVVPPTTPARQPAPPPTPKCLGDYRLLCSDLATLRYLTAPTATDDEFDAAVVAFLADERETAPGLRPVELGRLGAAAVARSTAARGCGRERADGATVAACGRIP